MGFAQELIDEIEYGDVMVTASSLEELEIEKEVEDSLKDAIKLELSGKLDYNKSAQRLIDISE